MRASRTCSVIALVVIFGAILAAPASAQPSPPSNTCTHTDTFAADTNVQNVAEAYALDAIDVARANFGVTLDWSDASIASVEEILGQLHERMNEAPSDDVVWTFSKMFGSYIGEVHRRNHGAIWGTVTLQGQSVTGLQAASSCELFWPWSRVHNRLVNGPEDNVWHYYQVLLAGNNE